ncbi:MAG: hypothetical protein LBH75_03690 [Treponema sp.]|jgi:hypothetical protein|nr:hypothetical protein [Treponema sp.]
MKRLRLIATAVAVISMFIVACGDNGGDDPPPRRQWIDSSALPFSKTAETRESP